ncbi:hypothetical protein ACJMK2_020793 [Sinanodonta woodiana]|uniref:Uncharacterized protein n=1 Tax=Sinanodonta woodiana TaxID=1069815 RepID=A0ABD3U085_SINWO
MSGRMNYIKVIFLFNAWAVYESVANCPLDLVIPHGYFNVSTDGFVFFGCDQGFILYGARAAQCFDDGWSQQPPHCITKGCPNVESADAMRVEAKYEGSQLSFSCATGFELEGNDSIYCNGSHWSAPIPKCVEKRGSLSCDFEEDNLCGWSHDPEGDFAWTWQTGRTPTQGTGPNNDHTFGPGGKGHYLFIETSSPTLYGYKAILNSPFYMPDESGQCFSFWYHSQGSGHLSRLEVFVWKEGENEKDLRPRFNLNYTTGDDWQNKTFYIEPQNKPFKIIFVGTRLKGHKHDIAIDDVSLGPCPENMTINTMAIITTTEMTTELTTKQTSTTTKETVTKEMTSASSAKISTSDIPNFSGRSGEKVTEFSYSIAKSTSAKEISSQKTTPPDVNVHYIKPGLNSRSSSAEVKNDVKDSVGDRKMDTMAVYIAVGVVAMVSIIVIVSTVYYLYQRRRRNKSIMEEITPMHNPIYSANLDHEAE